MAVYSRSTGIMAFTRDREDVNKIDISFIL